MISDLLQSWNQRCNYLEKQGNASRNATGIDGKSQAIKEGCSWGSCGKNAGRGLVFIPYFSGPRFVRTLHCYPCWLCPTWLTVSLSYRSPFTTKQQLEGFSNMWTMNFLMFKLVLEKAEEPEIKLPTSAGSSEKQEFQKNIYFCFIDYANTFDCMDHNKLWKSERDGNARPSDLPLEKSVCKSGSNS